MEREYLVEGLIVIVVLFILLVGFFSLFPEAAEKVKGFSKSIFGLGFGKTIEDSKKSVKLMLDSLDLCSLSGKKACVCDMELDIIPGENNVVVDNSEAQSKLILVNENNQVEAAQELGGRKVGVPVVVFDGKDWNAYCKFDSFIMNYDSGWRYRMSDVGSEFIELFSTDGISQYPVIKTENGNFCFVDEQLKGFDESAAKEPGNPAGLVKIGSLPRLSGTFSDYYSGEEFFNDMPKCLVLAK